MRRLLTTLLEYIRTDLTSIIVTAFLGKRNSKRCDLFIIIAIITLMKRPFPFPERKLLVISLTWLF